MASSQGKKGIMSVLEDNGALDLLEKDINSTLLSMLKELKKITGKEPKEPGEQHLTTYRTSVKK